MRRPGVILAALLIAGLLTASPAAAQGTPTVAGSFLTSYGSVTADSSMAGTTKITVNTARAILDFSSFNLTAGQTVTFEFADRGHTVLVRVPGGTATVDGLLNATIGGGGPSGGNVWLAGPAGVVFGPNATVNTGGLVATNADITTTDFGGLGDLAFTFDTPAVASTAVTPAVNIQSGAQLYGHGGLMAFVGQRVTQAANSYVRSNAGNTDALGTIGETEALFGAVGDFTIEFLADGVNGFDLLRFTTPPVGGDASGLDAGGVALAGNVNVGDLFVAARGTSPIVFEGSTGTKTAVTAAGIGGDVAVSAGGGIARGTETEDPVALDEGGPAQGITLSTPVTAQGDFLARATGDLTIASTTPGGQAVSEYGTVGLSTEDQFINDRGNAGVTAGQKWVVYSAHPDGNTYGPTAGTRLNSGLRAWWNRDIDDMAPGATGTGSRYIFKHSPTVTFTSLDVAKTWDEDVSSSVDTQGIGWTLDGLHPGVSGAFLADTQAHAIGNSVPDVSSVAEGAGTMLVDDDPRATDDGPYPVTISTGGLTSSGYSFAFQSTGTLGVSPVPGDTTPPTVDYALDGTLGDNGWHRSDVQVMWDVDDAQTPGAIATMGCEASDVTTDGSSFSFTCQAIAQGRRVRRTATVKRDATAPDVTATATSGGAPYVEGSTAAGDVLVTFSCKDGTSGVAPTAANLPVQTITAEGETPLVPNPGTCEDNAGNTARTWFGPVRIARPRPPVETTTTAPAPPSIPSAAQTRSVFSTQLKGALSTLRKLGLSRLRTRGYTRQLAADQAGAASEEILGAPRGARAAAAKPVVIARGTVRFTTAGKKRIAVKPTKAGKRALRGKRSLKLVVRTTFRPASGAKPIVVTSKATTVRRR